MPSVELLGFGAAPLTDVESGLRRAGIELAASEDGALVVAVTDHYLRSGLGERNARALRTRTPWVLVRPMGRNAWLGPLFVPGRTACWACLAQRLRANRQAETYLATRLGRTQALPAARAAITPSREAIADLVAAEVLRCAVDGRSDVLEQAVITLDLVGCRFERHRLVRRPQCVACGDPARMHRGDGREVRLTRTRRAVSGGDRSASPETTLKRYEHLVSRVTGVVTELSRLPSSNGAEVENYVAVHDFPMFREDMEVLRRNIRGRSGGKGQNAVQAKIGALGEAVERYSGVWRGEEEPTVQATEQELGERALSLRTCLGVSERQVRERERWNAQQRSPRTIVPDPLDPTLRVAWTPLFSLTNKWLRFLPSAYCYYGHPDMEHFFCLSDSNGCASGNTLEEAVLQGLLEVVERDAVGIWWYNRVRRPAVDVTSLELPYYEHLKARLRAVGRDLWVLDLRTDTTIPVCVAISGRVDHPVEDLILGFGAHLSPRAAVLRAVTELEQLYPTVAGRTARGDAVYLHADDEMRDWMRTATRENQPYLLPTEDEAPVRRADYPVEASDDLASDVMTCVDRLRDVGLEVFVLDQTRPDVGFPTCRVVVPGLCHFWRRLGSARLREVPRKLDWRGAAQREEDFNPMSVFI